MTSNDTRVSLQQTSAKATVRDAHPGEKRKVSDGTTPFNSHELIEYLRRGPDAIRQAMCTLERRLQDPRFAHKESVYNLKLTQLRQLLEIKLPTGD